MKKTTTIFLLSAIATIMSYSNLDAQVARIYNSTSFGGEGDIVTVNNASAKINNLFIMDSIKAPHIASFEIELNSAGDTKKILTSLLSAAQGNQPLKLSFSKLNYQNQIVEERDYKSVTVNEILLPDFNTTSKETSKLRVKIQAEDVSVKSDINEAATQLQVSTKGASIKGALSANFRLVMGNLPTQRVTSISNLRISNQASDGYMNFSVEVPRIDSKQWKDWFNTGAGGGRSEEATISFMDPTMSNEITSLHLSGVEIVSVSEFSNSSQDGIPKTMIGLRTRRLEFIK